MAMIDGAPELIGFPSKDEPQEKYTNWASKGTDENGNVYPLQRAYMNSSGVVTENASDSRHVTGFIPVKAGDIVRLDGFLWLAGTATDYGGGTVNAGAQRVAFYDANKAFVVLRNGNVNHSSDTNVTQVVADTDGNITQFTVAGNSIAYVRFALPCSKENVIITVNEPID